MCSEILDPDKLVEEFRAVCAQLDEVLKDIEWRKPDVEGEEHTLAELEEKAKTDPGVDVASQRIIVRVLRGVLDDKIALADRLEKRMNELRVQLEKIAGEKPAPVGEAPSGQAIREEEKRLG